MGSSPRLAALTLVLLLLAACNPCARSIRRADAFYERCSRACEVYDRACVPRCLNLARDAYLRACLEGS